MFDLGYAIVALVGYGLALLALAFAYMAFQDNVRLIRAGVDVDYSGAGRGMYFALMLAFLVLAAVIAMVTRWILGSF